MTDEGQKRSLDLSSEFHMLMGYCIAEWANADQRLFEIFRDCIGPYEQSAIIYYRTPGLELRLGLTDEIVLSVLPQRERDSGGHDHPDVARWKVLKKRFSDLLSIRRRIAHHPVSESRNMLAAYMMGVIPNNLSLLSLSTGDQENSWYSVYASQHERIRGRESDQKPLTRIDLINHWTAVSDLAADLLRFLTEVIAKHPATLGPPVSPQERGT